MSELFSSPGFWGFLGAVLTPLTLGIGYLVKRGFSTKDSMVKRYEQTITEMRREVEELNKAFTTRTEETMELRAHASYKEKLMQICEKELARLRERE